MACRALSSLFIPVTLACGALWLTWFFLNQSCSPVSKDMFRCLAGQTCLTEYHETTLLGCKSSSYVSASASPTTALPVLYPLPANDAQALLGISNQSAYPASTQKSRGLSTGFETRVLPHPIMPTISRRLGNAPLGITEAGLTRDPGHLPDSTRMFTTMVNTNPAGEPIIAIHTIQATSPPNALAVPYGLCGFEHGNTSCGDWKLDSCCSIFGFCGDSALHCGQGCQSGPCSKAPWVPGPGPKPALATSNPGKFDVVGMSGVPAMHAALMPNGKVIFLDKVEEYTQIKLNNGRYAYSAEYDPATNKAVGIGLKTNAFCCGGTFLADGRLISLGGNFGLEFMDPNVTNGIDGIRYLRRSSTDPTFDASSWQEPGNKLSTSRWYASALTLGDGSVFIASGSLNGLTPTEPANNNPTYELLTPEGITHGTSHVMDILNKNQPYYMYPFLHLLKDGLLFIFVAQSAELFNPAKGTTVRSFPDLPGMFRTYPNTGGSVLLPLSKSNNWEPEIMICGGGSVPGIGSPTDASCGNIQPLSRNPHWELDSMPEGRGMVEGTLLADGTIIWLNGCKTGSQGFNAAKDPAMYALIYDPTKAPGTRWAYGAYSSIPRLYHSVALLLLDGTMMVTGSNPNEQPILQPNSKTAFVTDFRVEIYTPPYLQGEKASQRPTDVVIASKTLPHGSMFDISFTTADSTQQLTKESLKIALYHGGFSTHSLHMGQRMIFLDWNGLESSIQGSNRRHQIHVEMPPNGNVAPPGPYVVYVLVNGVPAIGQFVMVG